MPMCQPTHRHCCKNQTYCWSNVIRPNDRAGRLSWKRKIGTVDLLVLTCLDNLLFILITIFSFFTKPANLIWRSNILSLPFQLVFLEQGYTKVCQTQMSVGEMIFDRKAWNYIDDVYEATPVEHLIYCLF
jgi:hypothetical protein